MSIVRTVSDTSAVLRMVEGIVWVVVCVEMCRKEEQKDVAAPSSPVRTAITAETGAQVPVKTAGEVDIAVVAVVTGAARAAETPRARRKNAILRNWIRSDVGKRCWMYA